MLSQKTIDRLANLVRIEPEELRAAIISPHEADLAIDDSLKPITRDQIEATRKAEYQKGKDTGVEMAVRAAKNRLNLDFPGRSLSALVEAAQEKALADSRRQPETIVADLQARIGSLEKLVEERKAAVTAKEAEIAREKIIGEISVARHESGALGPLLSPEEILDLMAVNGYEFKVDGAQVTPHKDGEPMRDDFSAPLQTRDVISHFLQEKRLMPAEPVPVGRGGRGSISVVRMTRLSELKAHFERQGKHINGAEFAEALDRARSEYSDFDMES